MTRYKEYNIGARGQNPLGSFGPILIMVLVLFALFYTIKGLFTILSFVAPILLLITLFIDRTVIFDYFKFIGKLLKENTLVGILGVVVTLVGWHVISGFLFAKAILKRYFKKIVREAEEREQGVLVEYEEVEEDEDDFLELPSPEKVKPKDDTNEYDDLFK